MPFPPAKILCRSFGTLVLQPTFVVRCDRGPSVEAFVARPAANERLETTRRLDRRPTEQYVCVISDFRVVAVNETFFVADVRRFSLGTLSKSDRLDGLKREKTLKIVGISSLRDASANRRFAFFPRLEISTRQHVARSEKSAKETENAADSTVDATTTRLPLVERGIVAPS
jgi:hypothetical protein